MVIASVVAVLLVGTAYILSGPNPFFTTRVDAKTSEELLKAYAAKDTDADGLPDWQEALYNTDPTNPESFKVGIKDGEAVAQGLLTPQSLASKLPKDNGSFPGTTPAAGSLTEEFSKRFMAQYLSTRGTKPPTQEEILTFVNSAVAELSATSTDPDAFTSSNVRVTTGGKDALTTYAAALEVAFANNTVAADKDALTYFEEAVNKSDKETFKQLKSISTAYKNIANAVIKVPVPPEAAGTHLAIANSLMHMSRTVGNMASMQEDPIRALVGIGAYDTHSKNMVAAFGQLSPIFKNAGVSFVEGQPGFFIARTADTSITAIQKVTTKP